MKKNTRKKIIDAISVLCLLAVFAGCFFWLQNWKEENGSGQLSGNGQEQEGVSAGVKTGTWCTVKSNSLDGVPIYDEAGGTLNVGLLPEGKLCRLVGSQYSGGKKWGQVEYAGTSGWLRMKYLNFISENDLSITKGTMIYINAATEKGIRAYEEPEATSDVVMQGITYGTEFEVLKTKNGWARIESPDGEYCWINLYYAGCYPSSDEVKWKVETLSKAQEINLREEPGEDERSIGKVPEDTHFSIEEFDSGWGKISYDGQEGWVMLSYLTPCEK